MLVNKKKLTESQILKFLQVVDKSFPIPLSSRNNLLNFSRKLVLKASVYAEIIDNKVVSMVAGYIDNVIDGLAYISVVATLEAFWGKRFASNLIKQFLNECKSKKRIGVHLYTNEMAQQFYRKLGFVDYRPKNDPRQNDIHLILKFEE